MNSFPGKFAVVDTHVGVTHNLPPTNLVHAFIHVPNTTRGSILSTDCTKNDFALFTLCRSEWNSWHYILFVRILLQDLKDIEARSGIRLDPLRLSVCHIKLNCPHAFSFSHAEAYPTAHVPILSW